jgi:hypothetical protein
MKDQVVGLIQTLAKSDYWLELTSEYGVGAATALAPIVLTDTPPDRIASNDVATLIAAQIERIGVANVDPETIFAYSVPQTTTITMPAALPDQPPNESCKAFGAFHDVATVGSDKTQFATAILPRCDGYLGHGVMESISTGVTHELIEAATDAYYRGSGFADVDFNGSGWGMVTGGGEVADLCKTFGSVKLPGTDWLVTRSWSNRSAAAGKDPCLPAAGRYFVAYPDFEGGAEIGFGVGTAYGKAIAVEPGQTRVVDVKLYAEAGEAGVTGPFTVSAEVFQNAPQFPAPAGQITLSLDATTGSAGDTLKLTITRKKTANDAFEPPGVPIVIHATMDGRTNDWLAIVGA